MIILSLDIGVTTGWAVIEGDYLHDYGQFPEDTFSNLLNVVIERYKPEFIVAEKPLIMLGELGAKLQKKINQTNYRLDGRRGFIWIRPSDWKDSRQSNWAVPKGSSQHEKDAIRMAQWYRFQLQGSERRTNVST